MLDGGLVRFRNGSFQQFASLSGAPDQGVRALLVDRQGRLWIGSRRRGLLRVDDPSAAQPVFSAYTKSSGLSSITNLALAEDSAGHIYAASGSGVDRIDPATGRIRRFTTADGLLPGELRVATRDPHGALWFGGDQGLLRIQPREHRADPPVVLVYSIRVNGRNRPISDLGDAEPAALSLSASERQVQVEFGGFRHDLLYQTLLSGVDQDWTAPSSSRSVHYLSLAPGSYELSIRAITGEGTSSSRPARVRFQVAAPVWQRGWFLLLSITAIVATVYAAHRIRVGRLLEMERLRRRIATDLHDDIGASLSQIAILSEVAREGSARTQPFGSDPLARIGSVSRELVDSMSDIVWAVSPRRDRLTDLVQRMRQFAEDVLVAGSVDFRFTAQSGDLPLDPDVRREVFLIFKECIHNAVRHSSCRRVEADLSLESGWLVLRIQDDGHGIASDSAPANGGHGLASMRRRAVNLGGSLEVTFTPGEGVTSKLRVPLVRRRSWRSVKSFLASGLS